MTQANYLLKGTCLPDGSKSDIEIRDGKITAIGAMLPKATDAIEIDLTGSVVLPGLVDLHTHLREPGKEDAETKYDHIVLTGILGRLGCHRNSSG